MSSYTSGGDNALIVKLIFLLYPLFDVDRKLEVLKLLSREKFIMPY